MKKLKRIYIEITKVYLNQDFQFEWPDLEKDEDKNKNKGFCYGARSHMAILVDGTVVP